MPPGDPKAVAEAATAIEAKQLTVFDVIASLKRTGYDDEAEAIMRLTRERLRGDQLQTSAIFDGTSACCRRSPTRTTTRGRAPATR